LKHVLSNKSANSINQKQLLVLNQRYIHNMNKQKTEDGPQELVRVGQRVPIIRQTQRIEKIKNIYQQDTYGVNSAA